jgi:multiple sugar transport system ATP-binding protein/alpha-glucoside transport system ATP-binding protein
VVNDLPPADRGIAMVFQSYALYPHMSVYENMAFGLRNAKLPAPEIDRRVQRAAKILQIEPLLERLPRALSGGQRQRVAIGRAIVREPRVFLFDEPLSNLDAALRVQTRIEIARLHSALKATMIYVTHDQVESMTLADRIVVLNAGRIEQVGTPLDLYDRPRNIFVAGFIGSPRMNFLAAHQIGGALAKRAATVGVRPEHLAVVDRALASMEGVVEIIEQLGEYVLIHVRIAEDVVVAKAERSVKAEIGQTVGLAFDAAHAHLFDETGEALA